MRLYSLIAVLILSTNHFLFSQISLNHIYLVLPHDQYTAYDTSHFLNSKLCSVRRSGATDQQGRSWNGLYLFGKNTYLELFDGPQNSMSKPGSIGIALSFDKVGQLDSLRKKLLDLNLPHTFELRQRKTEAGFIPWFKSLTILSDSATDGKIKIWIMEYESSYMRFINSTRLSTDDVTRMTYNARIYDSSRLLSDFVGISAEFDPKTMVQISTSLEIIGLEKSMGDTFTFKNPDFDFELTSSIYPTDSVKVFYRKDEISQSNSLTNQKGVLLFSIK